MNKVCKNDITSAQQKLIFILIYYIIIIISIIGANRLIKLGKCHNDCWQDVFVI